MNELRTVLDELVARAPVGAEDWRDVQARSSPRLAQRGRRRLVLAIAVVALLGLTGTAIAVGVDLLTQQERFHEGVPDDPKRDGPFGEVTSGDNWALIAWNSQAGLCLDFAIEGNSTFGCGFPVRGANLGTDVTGSGPPTHAIAGSFSGGNLVGGDGKATIFGVAASAVARVTIELADGRIIAAPLHDAPPALDSHVRFFIVRLPLAELERRPDNPVRAYSAYDSEGRLIERVAD